MSTTRAAIVVRREAAQQNPTIGYNVLTNEYSGMVIQGIIDLAKVTRSAVENAASIAGMILTTEALITDLPETTATASAGSMGNGMDC